MEYRATLRDGTVVGFDVAACGQQEATYKLAPVKDESDYSYRLRVLRLLSAKDVVSWHIADFYAPIQHAQGMYSPTQRSTAYETPFAIKLGVVFLVLTSIGVLILMIAQGNL